MSDTELKEMNRLVLGSTYFSNNNTVIQPVLDYYDADELICIITEGLKSFPGLTERIKIKYVISNATDGLNK